jgi:transposase-like protein
MSPPFERFYLNLCGAKVYEKPMKTYPEELKARVIARLLAPNNEYVPDLAKETGIPKDTHYAWRIK